MSEPTWLLGELDWRTPFHQVSWRYRLRYQWRVGVITIPCSFVAMIIWHAVFPHVLWFEKLWAGVITGSLLGLPIGYGWQLSDKARRSRTSGRDLVAAVALLGLLTLCCVFLMAPDFYWQEVELAKAQALDPASIVAISIQEPGRPSVRVVDRARLVSFAEHCHQSRLFYRNHETSILESQLKIELAEGATLSYRASVPVRHKDDLALRFRAYCAQREILIPKEAHWLREMK